MPDQSARHSLDKPLGNENVTRAIHRALIDEIDAAIPLTSEIRAAGAADTDDATTPTALPTGITYDQVLAAEGWPADGTLLTVKVDNDNVLQILSETDGDLQTRHAATTTTWSAWKAGVDLTNYARKDTAQTFTEDQTVEAANHLIFANALSLVQIATNGAGYLTWNARWDGTNWVRRLADGQAIRITLETDGSITIATASDAGTTAGSTITFTDRAKVTNEGRLEALAYTEAKHTDATFSGAETVNCNNGSAQQLTLTGNVSGITFDNVPATGKAFALTLFLKQDGTGSRTVTWPAAVKWPGGTAPTLTTTAARTDVVTLVTFDNGTAWYGFLGGKDFNA